jgi:mannose-6-phosphate isomerase-like protein (cupin superfamily)
MTSNIFKPIKIGKETFHPQSFDKNSFVMNYKLDAGGMVPPHCHIHMDEHFEIVKGEMKFKVNGKTIIKKTGEEIMVPKGVKHSIANVGIEQVEMNVKYMPCSDTHRFFEIVASLDEIKPATPKTLMQSLYIADKMQLKQFSHPQPMLANNIIMSMLKIVGKVSGWDKLVQRHDG